MESEWWFPLFYSSTRRAFGILPQNGMLHKHSTIITLQRVATAASTTTFSPSSGLFHDTGMTRPFKGGDGSLVMALTVLGLAG